MFNKVIRHYGTKGMRWGVRKAARKAARGAAVFVTGEPKSTSLIYPKGRKAAVAEGKAAVGKISGSKAFKSMVFDKNNSALTKGGRNKLAKQFKKNAAKRYAKAEKKATAQKAADQKRVNDTKKLINQMIKQDKAVAKHFGKSYNEASARQTMETFFKKELTMKDEY